MEMRALLDLTATDATDSCIDHHQATWHLALVWFLNRLRKPADFLLRIFGSRGEPAWVSAVAQVAADLENLNRTTERDFLRAGDRLMELRSVSGQISSEMTVLTELISGGRGNNTSQVLSRILHRSKDMDARAEAGGRELATVRDLASRIPLAFSELRASVMLYRTLCTLTRIETARLGNIGSDFEGLAEAVKPLSESIHLSGERILAESSQLDRSIRTVLQDSSDLQRQQLAELRSLIASVMDSLQSFAERRQQAHEASVLQTARNDAIAADLDNLVESIQFHDITRQQIEHVIHSLREVRSRPATATQAILMLQCSQLSSAQLAFVSSVERMRHSMEDISVGVQDMVEASGQLMGLDSREERSFFIQMESHCAAILKAIAKSDAHSTQILAMTGDLEQAIVRMKNSVAQIREIEIEIQRIAINASLRAAHIDAAGEALNTIAVAMRRLVLSSNGNTEDAARVLDSMSDATRRLSCNDGAAESSVDSSDNLNEMRAAIVALHSSSEHSFSQVNQIAVLGSDLRQNVDSILRQFAAGQLFAGVVTRAQTELQRVAADIGPPAGDTADLDVHNLDRFAGRYTMQVERDVHRIAANSTAFSQPAPPGSNAAPSEDDMGDNVEFF